VRNPIALVSKPPLARVGEVSLRISCRTTGPGARVISTLDLDQREPALQLRQVCVDAGPSAGNGATDRVRNSEHRLGPADDVAEPERGADGGLATQGVEHLDISPVVVGAAGLKDHVVDSPGLEFVQEPLEALASPPLGAFVAHSRAHDNQVGDVEAGHGWSLTWPGRRSRDICSRTSSSHARRPMAAART